jgi:hypothetical protein
LKSSQKACAAQAALGFSPANQQLKISIQQLQ